MQVLELEKAKSVAFAGNRFVIELIVPSKGPVQVKSCEVIGHHYRNKYTFPSSLAVSDVFEKALAAAVMGCMPVASQGADVVAMPDLTIELAGLTLSQAHVITNLSQDGHRSVALRFKTVLGCISNAFLPRLGIGNAVSDYSAHMSALVLADIVLPLLNMCSIVEDENVGDGQAFEKFLGTLAKRSREVQFQAELIKRFVTAATGPKGAALGTSTDQMFMRSGTLN